MPDDYTPTKRRCFALGIDPGWRYTGICILKRSVKIHVQRLEVYESTPNKKRKVILDDHDRLMRQYEYIRDMVGGANVVGIEAYKPNRMQKGMGGGAWKTAQTYAVACAALEQAEASFVFPHWPEEIKRMVGDRSASKEDVQNWLIKRISGLGDKLLEMPLTKREHACDAAAHAYLALTQLA